MKIGHPTRNKRVILIIGVFLLVATAAAVSYYYKHRSTPVSEPVPTINYTSPTSEQKSAGEEAKKSFETKPTEASQQQAAATGDTQTSPPTVVAVQIPTRTLNPSSNTISSIISTVDSAGKCTLTLTKSGTTTITASSATQTMGSYSSCGNFGLNLSNAPRGEWQATLTYTGSANQTGKLTKVLTLE